MLNRVLLAAAISWIACVTLGLLFAAGVTGRYFLFSTLCLPGVVPVALLGSTVVSIVVTPIAIWSLRTGVKNFFIYGSFLWFALAAYEVVIVPRYGAYGLPYGLYGGLLLGIVGLAILGFIPAAK